MKNNNGAAIRKLSNRSLKNNRMRNIFAVMAIILTAVLFTAVFSLTSGAIQTTQESTMHEVGSKSHVGLKGVTMEQYENIISDPSVKNSYYTIFVGMAQNILKRQAELRYLPNEESMENMFITLEEGSLPIAENEIIVDTFTLDELQLPYALGESIPLTFTFMGQTIEDNFTVCGYYKGDYISHASELFFSESYWNKLKGELNDEDFKKWANEHPEDYTVGLISGNIEFNNERNLEEKICTVIKNAGYEPVTDIRYGINWAYMSSRIEAVDSGTCVILIAAIMVILASGYLIIYNIFQISVISDIRFYGLLKTIGTTGKQIRKLINRQAALLSAIGIPIGLITGFLIGKAVLPFALSIMQFDISIPPLKFNLWIFVFGAAFSAFTVFFSCRKPGKIAGNVSPIEAVKYTQTGTIRNRNKKRKNNSPHTVKLIKNRERRRHFNPFSMALSNMGRNKRTTGVVITAISLSIILLAIIMTAVNSFRLDRYIEQRITGDFLLGNINFTNMSPRSSDFEIAPEYLKLADSLEGIISKNEMKVRFGSSIQIDANALVAYRRLDEEGKLKRDEHYSYGLDKLLSGEGNMEGHFYGYDKELLKNLRTIEGNIDIDKFQSGGYILLGTICGSDLIKETDHVYHPGDKVTVESTSKDSIPHEVKDQNGEIIDVWYENLAKSEYEVMAIVDIPSSMNLHRYSANACDAILPLSFFDYDSQRFAVSYRVEDEYQADFEKAIKDYSENTDPFMGYISKASLQQEFEGMSLVIATIGISLASVIALIGILNFINSVLTEIISRKREFAMLQSIGMTNSQLQRVLICEGISYIGIAGVISFILGSLLSWQILKALNNILLFFEYRFYLLPYLIMMPLLLFIAVLSPLLAFKQLKKKSIVERLRESE